MIEFTDDQMTTMIGWYESGSTFLEIAKRVGKQYGVTRTRMMEAGCIPRRRGGAEVFHRWHAKQKAKIAEAERILAQPRGGRPREHDSVISRVRDLADIGWSFQEIADQLNKETGKHRSSDAYRKLYARK